MRTIFLTTIIVIVAAINIRGIRQSSFVVNLFTVGKLLPLVVFVAAGLFFVDWHRLAESPPVSLQDLSSSALLLIFAFGGYEVIPVPAGEAKDPRRAVPFALIMTIAGVTILLTLAQVVTIGTLPGLATSKTPLADSAALFLGAPGAAMITLGAVLSTSGNNVGQALSGSRNLYALAEQGDLPPFFGRIHPRFHTPVNAIVVTSIVSLLLAISGTFQTMAAASAISRLIVYVATCASVLRLRTPRFGRGEACDVRRSGRARHSWIGDRDRTGDPGRGDTGATGRRRRGARRRSGAVSCCHGGHRRARGALELLRGAHDETSNLVRRDPAGHRRDGRGAGTGVRRASRRARRRGTWRAG